MNKRKNNMDCKKLTVDVNELAQMCSVGIATARKIGEDAGAVIHLGRRIVYSVKKVEDFLEAMWFIWYVGTEIFSPLILRKGVKAYGAEKV